MKLNLNLDLKDLVKYIIFLGVVYTILKIMPSKQISLQDLFLVILIIVGSVIFFHCFYNKETFQNLTPEPEEEIITEIIEEEGDNIIITVESEEDEKPESEDDEKATAESEDEESEDEESEGVKSEGVKSEGAKSEGAKSEGAESEETETDSEDDEDEEEEEDNKDKKDKKDEPATDKSKVASGLDQNDKDKLRLDAITNQNSVLKLAQSDPNLQNIMKDNSNDLSGSSKAGSSKPDSSKADSSKDDSSKDDSSKDNSSKADSSKPDSSKPDSSKPDYSKADYYKKENIPIYQGNFLSEQQNTNTNINEYSDEIIRMKNEMKNTVSKLQNKIIELSKSKKDAVSDQFVDSLLKDLVDLNVFSTSDVNIVYNKLNSGLFTAEDMIPELEKLKASARGKSQMHSDKPSSGDFITTYDLPPDFYKPLGSPELSAWDNQYTILNTDKWQVPQPRPPVCVNNSPCTVCPLPDMSSGYPASLRDWDISRKISNIPLSNKKLDLNYRNETTEIINSMDTSNESNLTTGMNQNRYKIKADSSGKVGDFSRSKATAETIHIPVNDDSKKNKPFLGSSIGMNPGSNKMNPNGVYGGGSAAWKERTSEMGSKDESSNGKQRDRSKSRKSSKSDKSDRSDRSDRSERRGKGGKGRKGRKNRD